MSVAFNPKMSAWTNHFVNMAKGNVPISDFYTVTKEPVQSGNGLVLVTPTEAVKRRAAAGVKKVYKRKRTTRKVTKPTKKRGKKPVKPAKKRVAKKHVKPTKKRVAKKKVTKRWLSR